MQRLFFTGAFKEDGQRRSPAFVLIFAVFDESKSWYGEVGERRSRERFRRGNDRKEYHTINGYVNATLPGPFFCLLSSTKTICRCRGVLEFALMVFLSLRGRVCLGLKICQGRSNVIWHLIGMGTAPEIHSIQFQDHSLEVKHCDTTMCHNLDNVFSPRPWEGRFLCFSLNSPRCCRTARSRWRWHPWHSSLQKWELRVWAASWSAVRYTLTVMVGKAQLSSLKRLFISQKKCKFDYDSNLCILSGTWSVSILCIFSSL